MGNDKVITVFKNKDCLIDYDHGKVLPYESFIPARNLR